MSFALVAHLDGNLVIVLGAWTGRVPEKLLAMLPVRVRMISALRSVQLKTKRLSGIIWTPEVFVAVLVEERDMAVGMVVAVVTLKRTPACLRRNVLRF